MALRRQGNAGDLFCIYFLIAVTATDLPEIATPPYKATTVQQMTSNNDFIRQYSVDAGNARMQSWHGAETEENDFR